MSKFGKLFTNLAINNMHCNSIALNIEQQFAGQMQNQVKAGEQLVSIDMESRKEMRDNIRVNYEKHK